MSGNQIELSSPQRPAWHDAADAAPSTRVLVVDDDRAVRELFRRVLILAGLDVVVAATGGAEGLRMISTDPQIAVVSLDLDMPGIDGRRFREAQRSDARLAHIPVIVVTATVLDEATRTALAANHYLAKPVNQKDYVNVIAAYCASSRRASVLLAEHAKTVPPLR